MGSILVRDLDQKTIERLKERAHLNGPSLQQEVKALLERAAETFTVREARRVSERWRRRLGGPSLFRQRRIDTLGSRFTMSVATSTSMT